MSSSKTKAPGGSPRNPVKSSKPAVILVGHGSREAGFGAAMEKVAAMLKKDRRFSEVSCAYLEIASPSIDLAIDRCVEKKMRQIRVLPYFVLTGRHVKSHIPQIIKRARKKYRGIADIALCPYLGYDEKIVALAKKRILEVS